VQQNGGNKQRKSEITNKLSAFAHLSLVRLPIFLSLTAGPSNHQQAVGKKKVGLLAATEQKKIPVHNAKNARVSVTGAPAANFDGLKFEI